MMHNGKQHLYRVLNCLGRQEEHVMERLERASGVTYALGTPHLRRE
jgi:hypothetical protein